MTTVSVVVPVYNSIETIKKCLDSLCRQTHRQLEILLVDDGSTDASPAVCDEYANKDSRIRVFHKENGGVSSARNLGLKEATGTWVVFVDSDDWVSPTYIEDLMGHCWNADIVLSSVQIQSGEGKFGKMSFVKEPGLYADKDLINWAISYMTIVTSCFKKECLPEGIYQAALSVPWGKAFSKTIIDRLDLKFDEHVKEGEDYMFNLAYLSNIKKFYYVDSAGYFYRYMVSSESRGYHEGVAERRAGCWKMMCDYLYPHLDEQWAVMAFKGLAVTQAIKLGDMFDAKNIHSNIKRKEFYSIVKSPAVAKGLELVDLKELNGRGIKFKVYCCKKRYFELLNILYKLKNFW